MSSWFDTETLERLGLRWSDSGHSVLFGELLGLSERVDRSLLALATAWSARVYHFPTFIAAHELQRLDYFRSFPHLVSFPVSLDQEEKNLESFVKGEVFTHEGGLQLTKTRPVREALTPAACYHLYIHEQGSSLTGARYYTTRNTCFRREAYYEPLRRQWSFSMREIVCMGSREEVTSFLTACRSQVEALLATVGLPVVWSHAQDPFFQPSTNPKYLSQRIHPTKTEAVFGGDLAIASINLHQDHFGATFAIERDTRAAYTGCVAFGIERWLYAVLLQHGISPRDWPAFALGQGKAPLARAALEATP